MKPLILTLSSPGAVNSFVTITFGLVAKVPPLNTFVHGSQTSPVPSLSPSSCPGSAIVGQSSSASQVPSPSPSGSPLSAGHEALDPVHASAMSHALAEDQAHDAPTRRSRRRGTRCSSRAQLSATSQTPALRATDRRRRVPWRRPGTRRSRRRTDRRRRTRRRRGGTRCWSALCRRCTQSLPTPSQKSAASHGAIDGRQTVVVGSFASTGSHASLHPVAVLGGVTDAGGRAAHGRGRFLAVEQPDRQSPTPSQKSVGVAGARRAARHAIDVGCLASAAGPMGADAVAGVGHSDSRRPDGRRPKAPAALSAGQLGLEPLQSSLTSHTPAAERHSVPPAAKPSRGTRGARSGACLGDVA